MLSIHSFYFSLLFFFPEQAGKTVISIYNWGGKKKKTEKKKNPDLKMKRSRVEASDAHLAFRNVTLMGVRALENSFSFSQNEAKSGRTKELEKVKQNGAELSFQI